MSETRDRVRQHRARLRAQGLRPIQIWVPDVRSAGFAEQAHHQSRAVAASVVADDDQDFVEAISDWPQEWRRGEVWTASGGPNYASKSRPVLIVQDDRFDTNSVTIGPFTTDPTDAPLFRILIEPNTTNGLTTASRLMVDKLTTIRRTKIGDQLGVLDDADILRTNRAIIVFLGIAATG